MNTMPRKTLPTILLYSLLFGLSISAKPLNVVFFLIDDLGWNDVGASGSEYYRTPNIDKLSEDGMRFTNGYAACNVCSPTRAAIMTGKYPARLLLFNGVGITFVAYKKYCLNAVRFTPWVASTCFVPAACT